MQKFAKLELKLRVLISGITDIGLFQKKSAPPRRMGSFFNPPLSPGFPEAQDPPSCLDFQDKRPPSRLDFREKILGLNLIYF